MTTVNSTTSAAGGAATILPAGTKTGYSALGASDFLQLLTTEMQNQDPTAPVDNKEMLAQMAQFSTLSATTDNGTTLQSIAAKLDTLIARNGAIEASIATAQPAPSSLTTTAA